MSMTCTRAVRTAQEAKAVLRALEILKVDREDITIHAWGDWVAKDGDCCYFKDSSQPVVERIGRIWCVLNRPGYELMDAKPENDEVSHGLIEIRWEEE